MDELIGLLRERGLPAPDDVLGEGVARVLVAGAEKVWPSLRDLPGFWPVIDGGGVEPPDAAEVARALALGRAFDAGSWLRRRRTVYEAADLPEPRPEPPAGLGAGDALLLVPTDVPWSCAAILGLGGGPVPVPDDPRKSGLAGREASRWGLSPDPEHHVAVHRRWHELYGAELAWASGSGLTLWVERPPETVLEAKVLAREQLAYCAGILAEPAIAAAARAGQHPLEAIAAARLGAQVWRFSW